MARINYWQYLVDGQGNPLSYVDVRIYLAGTTTEANIFLNNSFGSFSQSSVENLKTDQYGFFQFWIGDEWETEGGYEYTQQFKIIWQNTVDGIQEEIDDISIFAPVLTIDASNNIKGVPSNKDVNRVISNQQGYKWDTHIDSVVPSASPHDLEPVVFFDLDTRDNKLISDKIGYQMYEMASTASTTPIDISAARFHGDVISSWNASGGIYYADVTHNFNNYYPIVVVIRDSTDFGIIPEKIESISPDVTRVWLTENVNVSIGFFG
jgi:hypothetical protein